MTESRQSAVGRIVLVGHCGFDVAMLQRAVKGMLDGAAASIELITADDGNALGQVADGESLLLVNRVLEGGFDTDSGMELIERLLEESDGNDSTPRVMLISNYADAQQAAIAAGAHPGFGKGDVHSDGAKQRLRAAAGLEG